MTSKRDYARCMRCGISREVNPYRGGVPDLCADCRLVEKDLAAMHGTAAGYKRHWRAGELACDDCLRAHTDNITANYRKRGRTPRPVAQCGTESGYRRHLRAGEPACDDCRRATSKASLARYYRRKEAAA